MPRKVKGPEQNQPTAKVKQEQKEPEQEQTAEVAKSVVTPDPPAEAGAEAKRQLPQLQLRISRGPSSSAERKMGT